MKLEIGSRVVLPGGDVGHVEEIAEDGLWRVRLLTPKNEPSWLSTWIEPDQLGDGTNVRPRPRSKAWHAESRRFCAEAAAAANAALHDVEVQ